jgi:hypothetical protein
MCGVEEEYSIHRSFYLLFIMNHTVNCSNQKVNVPVFLYKARARASRDSSERHLPPQNRLPHFDTIRRQTHSALARHNLLSVI